MPPRSSRAHPRPCGEHLRNFTAQPLDTGSSPPVRGAHHWLILTVHPLGLIPARAGSTKGRFARARVNRAHPRPCGEHHSEPCADTVRAGSSPPVRGARVDPACDGDDAGLIPARAGSTPTTRSHTTLGWAHPRPCGEHVLADISSVALRGSSPPVRGARR